ELLAATGSLGPSRSALLESAVAARATRRQEARAYHRVASAISNLHLGLHARAAGRTRLLLRRPIPRGAMTTAWALAAVQWPNMGHAWGERPTPRATVAEVQLRHLVADIHRSSRASGIGLSSRIGRLLGPGGGHDETQITGQQRRLLYDGLILGFRHRERPDASVHAMLEVVE